MQLRVDSEIGRLRRVLVHRPGREIDWMTPSIMEHLLFDDILDGDHAREEHDDFSGLLRRAGAEVLDTQDLLAQTLESAEARTQLLEDLALEHDLHSAVVEELQEKSALELAEILVEGLRGSDFGGSGQGPRPASFDLAPVPNFFFQRDPLFVMGTRVMVSTMATEARAREPLLSRTCFRYHPALSGAYEDLAQVRGPERASMVTAIHDRSHLRHPYATVEGGDVLVASPEVLLVGLSERTNRRGVEALADYLRTGDSRFRHLVVVELPPRRSFMHLDTVFTFIDRGACLAHLPVIEPGRPESAHVYYVDLESDELSFSLRPSLQGALSRLGIEVELIPCGGADDVIDQHREQWTDGANAFAVAPGVILIYRRNRRTLEELARRGWRVVSEDDILQRGEEIFGHGPTVISVHGHELSRARGGPRCMTMPLERDPLTDSSGEPQGGGG